MKLIKINPDHYVIVDDSKMVEGDYGIMDEENFEIFRCSVYMFPNGYTTPIIPQDSKKITHSTKPIESINVINSIRKGYDKVQPLSLSEVKELIGEVDVENNAIEWYNGESKYNSNYVADPYSWKEGYNQALEDNKDRKYTEEDMRAVFMHGFSLGVEYLLGVDRGDYSIDMEDRAMSHYTQPKTQWEVEFIDGKLKLK